MLLRPVRRLQLSRAKHRSLAGHSNISKFIARLLPHYEFGEESFFNSDRVSGATEQARRAGFERLANRLASRASSAMELSTEGQKVVSDMQFVKRYRVPYPYSRLVREHLPLPSFAFGTESTQLLDDAGRAYFDLTGSYGVNVFGHTFYQECLKTAQQQAGNTLSVLGYYHPSVVSNAQRLANMSGMDEVSFHMSGTEAVMQAVRLARYHTKRRYVVRFCGAYHGWWGDVQPGLGNPSKAKDTFTLADMSERTLKVLATRTDIACVLVNPLQALHPNRNAPGDSTLLAQRQNPAYDRQAYTEWLHALRKVCDKAGIALIMDEVFVGFRIAKGGAQSYFNVKADLVTYGKTLGGGLPVGVLCGRAKWMRRFREERPTDICFARGTFNSHPLVMASMQAFLDKIDTPEITNIYESQEAFWEKWLSRFNEAFHKAHLPISVSGMQSIWTVNYHAPSRYHWMLQFYLREQYLALSWVGTGRLIFSLNYTDADMQVVLDRFLKAALQMQADGWWQCGFSNARQIAKQALLETLYSMPLVPKAMFGVNPLALQKVKRGAPV